MVLRGVAGRFEATAVDVSDVAERLAWSSFGVRLNGSDPGFDVARFHERRALVGERLGSASTEWRDDSTVVQRTSDEALAADAELETYGLFDRVVEVIEAQPPWSRRGVFHEELVAHRAELLNDLSGGSRVAGAVLGEYSASGGSLRDLFEAVGDDDGEAIARTTVALASRGRMSEAERLDRVLAVARLVASDDEANSSIGAFDGLVDGGVDVAVAANMTRAGVDLPSEDELVGLVERLEGAFAGGTLRLSREEVAWAPFALRVALDERGSVDPDAVADARLAAAEEDAAYRAGVIGLLGAAGLDSHRGGSVLGGLLQDMVMPERGGPAPLETHRFVADVVGDPRAGLGAGFFDLLGAEGSVELADQVWRSTPIDMHKDELIATVAEIVGAYGDGMAVADREGELGFTAAELSAVDDPTGSAGFYLGADEVFGREFAVEASTLLIEAGRGREFVGVDERGVVVDHVSRRGFDPRAMALDHVAANGVDASLALFGALGDDFRDDLLWNAEPFESAAEVHPVVRVVVPVLDNPHLWPGLAEDVVVEAGSVHAGEADRYTGRVIEYALLTDIELLAPENNGRRTEEGPMARAEIVVAATESVFRTGGGDGLIAYANGVTPVMIDMVRTSGSLDAVPDHYTDLNGEIIGKTLAARTRVAVDDALAQDRSNGYQKFYGAAVATALIGTAPMSAPVALGVGLTANVAVGHLSEFVLPTDAYATLLEDELVAQRDLHPEFSTYVAQLTAGVTGIDVNFCPVTFESVEDMPILDIDGEHIIVSLGDDPRPATVHDLDDRLSRLVREVDRHHGDYDDIEASRSSGDGPFD